MRNYKIILLACLATLAQPVLAADPAPVFVIVNGVAVDRLQADLVRMDLQQRKRPAADDNVRSFLIDNELLAQEALRRGLDQSAEIKALIELQRKDILAKALIDDYITRHPVADERAKAEYDQIKAKTDDTEYLPRHILVDNEKLAKAIINSLNIKKKTFETLAKQYSKDPTGKEGGELGWLAAGNVVPEFATAMVALKKGEYSKTPVKTQFGWHVIRLDDVRKIDFPEFDKVKGRIANQLAQQDVRKYLAELRSTAKIETPSGQ